jgi:hypothetical protein
MLLCKLGCWLERRPIRHTSKAGRGPRSLPVKGSWFVVAGVLSLGDWLRCLRPKRGHGITERAEKTKRQKEKKGILWPNTSVCFESRNGALKT